MALFWQTVLKKFMANKNLKTDLQDSEKDIQKLQPEQTTIDMPDVKDIPGQQNIRVPNMREMADTTISSDDEEGVGIWDDENTNEDASNERIGAAQQFGEDDLNSDEDELEVRLDNEDNDEGDEDDELDITDDSVSEDSDVTPDEITALDRTAENMDTDDNENLYRSELDDTDFDGEKLNEDINVSGDDLDVPGSEDDDADEEIGEEDEENNSYSMGDND